MKATNPWITYRTRFLVKARQLTTSLCFADALGRQHSGRKGDYLVESSDGVLRIAPRQIFEDVYVPLLMGETPQPTGAPQQACMPRKYESLLLKDDSRLRDTAPEPTSTHQRETPAVFLSPHLARKSPQPYRDRRSPTPGFRSV